MDKAGLKHKGREHTATQDTHPDHASGDTPRFVDPRDGVFLITLIVGLVLMAMVWLFTQTLSGVLAETHLRHKASGIAAMAADTLNRAGWNGRGELAEPLRRELRQLVRFSDAERLAVADANGRVVFSTDGAGIPQRLAAPRKKPLSLRMVSERDGEIVRRMAHVMTRVTLSNGQSALVAMAVDATGTLAWYRQIGLVFAKVMAVLVIAAMLLIGLLVHRRLTERMQAMATLEALRQRNDEEHRRAEALQMKLVRLQEELAALNRRLAETMRQNQPQGPAGDRRQPRAANGD